MAESSTISRKFTADFETTTDPNDLRIWSWGLYDIENDIFIWNNNIHSFVNYVRYKLPNWSKIYFHNLKFDGEFLMHYLFKNGFTHRKKGELKHMEFKTLISNMGVFYSIQIKVSYKTITFLDSLKLIPLKVADIPKCFNLDSVKGEIDYKKPRPVGYKPTSEEIEYLKNDVKIVGKALKFFFENDLNKMTVASNSLKKYKDLIKKKKFEKRFPVLNNWDEELRKSYKGGITMVKEDLKGKDISNGISLDVNSLYPYVMHDRFLPYGEPIYYKGKVQTDDFYNVYIQKFICNFELKEGFLPMIQLKKNFRFKPTEFLKSSDGLDVELVLTSVDMEMFLKHYNVYNIQYIEGWSFRSSDQLFKDYIDYWIKVKNDATISGNDGMRTIAKLMLNSLYGKFGLNPHVQSKHPLYDGENISYKLSDPETRDPIYVPIASFITAHARKITLEAAQLNYDRFIYCDTDSIHLIGEEEPTNIKVDGVELGAWKVEGKFERGRFLRAKSYVEEEYLLHQEWVKKKPKNFMFDFYRGKWYHLNIKCAGLPDSCKEGIMFEDFKVGLVVQGKLQQKREKGGVYLKEIEFTIDG